MVLFHGTSFDNGQQILNDKTIKINCKSQYENLFPEYRTTSGFVYFSSSMSYATSFGSERKKLGDTFLVFKIDIPENEIEEDSDDKNMLISSSNISYRIGHSISVNDAEYIIISVDNSETYRNFSSAYKDERKNRNVEYAYSEFMKDKQWTKV